MEVPGIQFLLKGPPVRCYVSGREGKLHYGMSSDFEPAIVLARQGTPRAEESAGTHGGNSPFSAQRCLLRTMAFSEFSENGRYTKEAGSGYLSVLRTFNICRPCAQGAIFRLPQGRLQSNGG